MGTSSERVFNGSGKGYLPAGTIGNRTHILSERLKAGTEFKRLKKGHRPAPMPLKQTHILSYKPQMDLTWDDTSDSWYGDLDQRHLYFGLTDELMAIAHSGHTVVH